MSKMLPLADELRAAIQLLRDHDLSRAANRLEALSKTVLHPHARQKTPRTTAVKLVLGSGRTVKAKFRADLLERTNCKR